jgi:hypothetical protein
MFFMFIGAIRCLATRYNADHARPARVCDSRGARAALVMEKLMRSPLTCKIGLVRVEARTLGCLVCASLATAAASFRTHLESGG